MWSARTGISGFLCFFFFQAEDGIRDRSPSRGLGDVYKRQDQRGIVVATWTNGTVGVNMFTYASHFVKIESGKKMKFLLQIKGTQFRFLSYGSLTEWKNIPNYAANKTVDHPLILGAGWGLSLIHISEPTRRTPISYAVFCLKKKKRKKRKKKKQKI